MSLRQEQTAARAEAPCGTVIKCNKKVLRCGEMEFCPSPGPRVQDGSEATTFARAPGFSSAVEHVGDSHSELRRRQLLPAIPCRSRGERVSFFSERAPRQPAAVTAPVTGSANTAVTWSVNGAAGGSSALRTISSSGADTAPPDLLNPASVTVTATTQADSTKSASATVEITSDATLSIQSLPATSSIQTRAMLQLRPVRNPPRVPMHQPFAPCTR